MTTKTTMSAAEATVAVARLEAEMVAMAHQLDDAQCARQRDLRVMHEAGLQQRAACPQYPPRG